MTLIDFTRWKKIIGKVDSIRLYIYLDVMTRRVASANATKIAYSITLDNRFSGGESGVSIRVGRVAPAPVPLSDSVDFADAEYNSVKQLSITESSVESRASEARIPEPQFPSLLLLSLCRATTPALVRLLNPVPPPLFPPDFRKDEAPSHLRRAVKRSLLPERTLIRSPLPPRALCSVDPE